MIQFKLQKKIILKKFPNDIFLKLEKLVAKINQLQNHKCFRKILSGRVIAKFEMISNPIKLKTDISNEISMKIKEYPFPYLKIRK